MRGRSRPPCSLSTLSLRGSCEVGGGVKGVAGEGAITSPLQSVVGGPFERVVGSRVVDGVGEFMAWQDPLSARHPPLHFPVPSRKYAASRASCIWVGPEDLLT